MTPDRRLTILLADDSADDVFFFQRALLKTSLPAVLHVAENGRKAIEFLSSRSPDGAADDGVPAIVFVDLKMPEVDGFDLLVWISQNYPSKAFRTVALTASDQPRDRSRAMECGADGYFVKPITHLQLVELLQPLAGTISPPS